METSDKIKIVIVGHIDHGKSSLIGRLLYDTNSIAKDKITELESISRKLGSTVEYAYLMDHLQEEREQGITIDTTQTFFKTSKREYVIIDAPGHVEFVKNMVTGAAQAETAILIVDANEGIQEQTKRHAFILSMLGMDKIILAINKMDLVDYNKQVFENIVGNIENFLGSIGLHIQNSIPISAIKGDNVAIRSTNLDWYDGNTILEALDNFDNKQDEIENRFILPIQDIYKINAKRIAVGRVEAGKIMVGDEVLILPTMQKTQIKTIEKFLEDVNESEEGESIGITTVKQVFMERGSIVCNADSKVYVSDCFQASIFWMSVENIKVREKVTLRCATQEVSCEIKEIHKKVNSSTLESIYDDMNVQKQLEVCQVSIQIKKPITISTLKEVQTLGRFVILKNNNICGGGIITSI